MYNITNANTIPAKVKYNPFLNIVVLGINIKKEDTTKNFTAYKIVENSIGLSQLTPIQKVLAIKSDFNYDIISIIKMSCLYCFVLIIIYKTYDDKLFHKKLSNYFLYLCILLIFFYLLEKYREFFTTKLIREITFHKYTFYSPNNTIFSLDNLLFLGTIWICIVLFRAEKNQKENDLTI